MTRRGFIVLAMGLSLLTAGACGAQACDPKDRRCIVNSLTPRAPEATRGIQRPAPTVTTPAPAPPATSTPSASVAPQPAPPPQTAARPLVPTASRAPQLVPVREFLRGADIPPVGFGAYGIMALRAKPTPGDRARLKMACASFVSTLARAADVPKSVPLSDQMVTVWPLDAPDAAQARNDNCDFLLEHYELFAADSAIADAERQRAKVSGRGPFLIGWSPSNTRGVPDKVVLVVDMSSFESQDSFNQALLFWKQKVVEDPALWRSGFSLGRFRLSVRDFVDHYGQAILAAAHLSSE